MANWIMVEVQTEIFSNQILIIHFGAFMMNFRFFFEKFTITAPNRDAQSLIKFDGINDCNHFVFCVSEWAKKSKKKRARKED